MHKKIRREHPFFEKIFYNESQGSLFEVDMIIFLGAFLSISGLIMLPCWAQNLALKNDITTLSCEKEEIERDPDRIAGVLIDPQSYIDRVQNTVDRLLSQTEEQNKKIQEHFQALMEWRAQKKIQKSHKIFEKTHAVKECLAQAALISECSDFQRDQKKITELTRHLQELTKENEVLVQKIKDRQGLVAQVFQKQQNISDQIEKSPSASDLEMSVKPSFSKGVPIITQDPDSLEVWNTDRLAHPLPQFTHRATKNLFGAQCISTTEAEPISAIYEGDVVFSDLLKGLGQVIMIQHSQGYLSVYGNCKNLLKKVGDRVSTNDLIAFTGHTGQFGKDCLYFEIRHNDRSVDPAHWFAVQN